MRIAENELSWKFARSSGAGGQNVNKVSSKAVLTWSPANSMSLPEDVKARFIERYSHRLSRDGFIQIQSSRFRDQPRNVRDCLEKLEEMISSVWQAPTARKKTKPSRTAKLKRLESKRRHSEKKRTRSWSGD